MANGQRSGCRLREDAERLNRLLRICDSALVLSGEARRSFLEAACHEDPLMLAEVQAVLAAVGQSLTLPLIEPRTSDSRR